MNINIGGYLMEDLGPASKAGRGNRIKVTYIAGVDMNGVFAVDWVARKLTPHHVKGVVEYLREKAREAAGEGRGGEGGGGGGGGGGDEGSAGYVVHLWGGGTRRRGRSR